MRSPVAELLAALAGALRPLGVRWYLFGAQAALLYGAARLTADVDVTVDLGQRSWRTLVDALGQAGFQPRSQDIENLVEQARVIPLVHTGSALPVDVVLAGPGLEALFLDRARERAIEGVVVPVASPEDILAMKVLAGRPKDEADAVAILAARGDELDLERVRETLRLLEQALDRSDLVAAFEELNARARH